MSIGIVAFVLVAIFGLLSVGINASRDSGDDTKVAFIMQDVAAKLRTEVSSDELAADPSKMDLTWNAAYGNQLDYKILRRTNLPTDGAGKPQPAALAYYTSNGQFVKQSTVAAPTENFYKASVYIQHLNSYPPQVSVLADSDGYPVYPFLAVTIKIGWPTDKTVNGNVQGAANVAKSAVTFYLSRP